MVCQVQFEYSLFHLHEPIIMSIKCLYAFSGINSPYSVKEQQSFRKTVIHGNEV